MRNVLILAGTGFIIVILASWTSATLLQVSAHAEKQLREYLRNGMMFIPKYGFFAPNPGDMDYHLLYRDKLEDGSVTSWKEVDDLHNFPTRTHWLWNPKIYKTKAIFDHAENIVQFISNNKDSYENTKNDRGDRSDSRFDDEIIEVDLEDFNIESVIISAPYVCILNYINNANHHENCIETQFLIMENSLGNVKNKPIFLSNFHEVTSRG